jgi:hypothetical protein
MKLTQERVRELFDYRSDGELIRKVQINSRAMIGDVAGNFAGIGYKQTRVDGKRYKNHRLIWLWHHGYFPENDLDHINRVRDDNRIENLREVNRVCNLLNAKQRKSNRSGVTGVSWYKESSKWCAGIKIHSKRIHLGLHDTILEAARARWDAEVKYEWPSCNSTSSAYLFLKEAGEI